MSNRLTKIYTRTGDNGTTELSNHKRVNKSDTRIEAMGDIDELNSIIGLLRADDIPNNISSFFTSSKFPSKELDIFFLIIFEYLKVLKSTQIHFKL